MSPDPTGPSPDLARRTRPRPHPDAVAGGLAIGLVVVAAVVGGLLWLAGSPVYAPAAPLFAHWLPHAGPGTPPAVAIAVLVCVHGPRVAATLSWRWLPVVAYPTAVAWTLALALVDGWDRGVAGRLTTTHEYLHEVPGVTDVPAMLAGFTGRILDFQPDSWTTHVSGHPPGALLVFVALDRLGLGGGGWAGMLCVLTGALIAVAVPWTVRSLGTDDAARAAVPFVVLFPGAVWVGVSADGLFAGVTATGIALLASGAVRRRPVRLFTAGVLLGFGCFLSYGLVLMAPIALAVLVLARTRVLIAVWAPVGAAVVVAAFAAAGFWWPTGYHLVIERYYQGIATDRRYAYWVWANLAALTVSAGPAAAAIVRRAASRAVRAVRPRIMPRRGPHATWVLVAAAVLAILAADASGYSKAEVERIWLPFAIWLLAGAGMLPLRHHRAWLGVQAAVALIVNHLLLTHW
ncbi:hypothetical protein [Catenuloplanes japonicus]|uniref:hypothetical protein n=1 Tax=Catenuloplanes japonicus TaxID=33876 RepID=UPI00068B3A91|nr:hypothetical protein [Catenuloplanes japonicus]